MYGFARVFESVILKFRRKLKNKCIIHNYHLISDKHWLFKEYECSKCGKKYITGR